MGNKSHSLGGPAAAKITDKLTYKESFYFASKPQRLPAEPPAGEQHEEQSGSFLSSARVALGHLRFLEKLVPTMPGRESEKGEGGGRAWLHNPGGV